MKQRSTKLGELITVDKNGYMHSFDDQPSIVGLCGSKCWHKNGMLHRENGPAFMQDDGAEQYWLDGTFQYQDDSKTKRGMPLIKPSLEQLKELFSLAPNKEVEDAILKIAMNNGHAEHAVIF